MLDFIPRLIAYLDVLVNYQIQGQKYDEHSSFGEGHKYLMN